jgi:hypothetical protein
LHQMDIYHHHVAQIKCFRNMMALADTFWWLLLVRFKVGSQGIFSYEPFTTLIIRNHSVKYGIFIITVYNIFMLKNFIRCEWQNIRCKQVFKIVTICEILGAS